MADFNRLKSIDDSARAKALLSAVNRLHKSLQDTIDSVPTSQQPETQAHFKAYERLFQRFLTESDSLIDWDKINPPPKNKVMPYKDLKKAKDDEVIKQLLGKLVVLKLNGGLGTTMGCTGPKSVIEVRDGLSFLDMTVRQIEYLNEKYDVSVPLVLMNSFNTHSETSKILGKYDSRNVVIRSFMQSKCPRIGRDTMVPITQDIKDAEGWYPPGHGDLYESLINSGLLDEPEFKNREYLFISNVDNLGATVDTSILSYLVNEKPECEFVMEVTDKTRADVKGGTLCEYEGKLRLLEIAQVPKEHVEDFKSVKKFRIFNTNNLWVKISALRKVVAENVLELEIIVNPKVIDNGTSVIQLETAVGAAMKHFDSAIGINVPRARFLPVKGTSDLLLVKSDLYQQDHGSLVMNPQRMFESVPLVKLGDEHFKKVGGFLKRFATIPNVLELDHLTVTGDVTFGAKVTLKGTVIIVANHGERIDIPAGSVLENKVVSGNLRILDH